MFHQFQPSIPVYVSENDRDFPSGSGAAIGFMDYSCEHYSFFLVGMDLGGKLYWVPQQFVRLAFNLSMGRIPPKTVDSESA